MSDYDPNTPITIPMAAPDSGVDSDIYAARIRAENADLRTTVERLTRELHRLTHGNTIEGDGVCEHELRAAQARAWSRLWHAEALRLWRALVRLGWVRPGVLTEPYTEVDPGHSARELGLTEAERAHWFAPTDEPVVSGGVDYEPEDR